MFIGNVIKPNKVRVVFSTFNTSFPPAAEGAIVESTVPTGRPLHKISAFRSRLLPCTLTRMFWAVKPLPTGILPKLLLNEASEAAGISMKELALAARVLAFELAVSGPLEVFITALCPCVDAWPNDTGNCRLSARAEAPQPGVALIVFSEPKGI